MADIAGPDLCYCLAARRVARILTRTYDRHLAPAGINTSQFSILCRLRDDPGAGMSDLARFMAMERTTMVRALRPLREQGLVDAAVGTARELAFELTRAGREKIEEAAPMWRQAQAEHERTFGLERASDSRYEMIKFAEAG